MKKQVTPSQDPAVIALNRVAAAREDDSRYLVAIVELETCRALTAQGVRAKRNLERSRISALNRGDVFTAQGRMMMEHLAHTIDDGLARLTREAMRKRRSQPAYTPGPPPTPRGGARRL
ncbi:hypothetical protein [Bradyrhizobium sp. CCBAU 11430]|uniref:hypothetical protein n=1 Tax=Bradyrhizobium sp. CCBAU 11430 TaxID=1630881 RepID=UPI0023066CEB|nr:hypothetical protein [Bradyrhizobium sp. CCBAU 11430]